MDQGYSDREAARLCCLTLRQVRSLVRAGVVGTLVEGAERRVTLHLQDLTVLRATRLLLLAGFALPRVGRALVTLRGQLRRRELPLSAAQLFASGNRLCAFDGHVAWNVETGDKVGAPRPGAEARLHSLQAPCPAAADVPQFVHPLLDSRRPRPQKRFAAGHGAYGEADAWFARGIKAERAAPKQACAYYLQAIACNPEHVESFINLGHLCAGQNETERAAAFFRLATRIDPGHAVAHFNLAVVLDDKGACGAAMQAYRRAILLDPNFADAHFNLGTLLAQQGHAQEAGTHFTAFRAATRAVPPRR